MSQATYRAIFMVAWLGAAAYVFSVWRLARSVRLLKSQGRAPEAPDIHFNLPHAIPGSIWLVTGRYAKLGDEAVTRWSIIARILLALFFPVLLALFGIAVAGIIAGP